MRKVTLAGWKPALVLAPIILIFLQSYAAAYDLSQVKIEKLQNGMTVMILEDHIQPLVSTQVLYKVGARNECDGTTGVAHFVEHMSFRATKNFPNTDVVSRIYAVGGEWHGYTWIDETTYFETVPVKYLDLVLQIQSDRMQNAVINPDEVEAERGAVLTELHSYENDPALVLSDQVLAVSFLEHPYRNNTIGWTSDVEKITHDDLSKFYHRYYHPSNAVLAIAGDVKPAEVIATVHRFFDSIPTGDVISSMPRTVEPPQIGERRIVLQGTGALNYFQITYHAPAATSPDYPAFLLLQAVLGGAPGLNLRQDLDGEVVHSNTRLAGIGRKISTFFMPTADPYVFSIEGQTDAKAKSQDIEAEVEKRIAAVRETLVADSELEAAKKQLSSELVFDIETTEDATHQMAYFEGIGAFPVLEKLPELLLAVQAKDVRSVARKYLQPYQRTIGWYLAKSESNASLIAPQKMSRLASKHTASLAVSEVQVRKLKNGITAIVSPVRRTPAGFLRLLVPSNNVESNETYTPDDPVWRFTSLHWRFLKEDFASTLAHAKKLFDGGLKTPTSDPASMEDPEFRLNQTLEELVGATRLKTTTTPSVVALVGDIEPTVALSLLDRTFGALNRPQIANFPPLHISTREKTVRLSGKAQSQFGYAVLAPPSSLPDSYAFRILLYILTHGYEGRLGKELIARKGLIYYISSAYRSDGKNSWIAISFGVNPGQLQESRAEFNRLMDDLREHPPTLQEVQEGKDYLLGRRLTAYQSNEELSAFYAREWVEQGRLLGQEEFETSVRGVKLEEVQKIVPQFLSGVRAIVDTR